MKIANKKPRLSICLVLFSLLTVCALVLSACGQAPSAANSVADSVSTAASSDAGSTAQDEALNEALQAGEERVQETKQLLAAAQEALGSTVLAYNERVYLASDAVGEGQYLLASGGGEPVASLDTLLGYYPAWSVVDSVGDYQFDNAIVLALDNPAVSVAKLLPDGVQLNEKQTVELQAAQVQSVTLLYKNGAAQLSLEAYGSGYDLSGQTPPKATEALENGYSLLTYDNSAIAALHWEDGAWSFYLKSDDTALLKALAQQDVGAGFAFA